MSNNYDLITLEPISNVEASEIIKTREAEVELTYREEKVREYFKKFEKLTKEDFEKAKEELISLEIPRLAEEHIIKIIDLMPSNGTQLRSIVSHSGTVLVDENVTKILDVLKKYS